ncbi:MAG: hypothetical protein SGPRY_012444 [Prymnesium sp.]
MALALLMPACAAYASPHRGAQTPVAAAETMRWLVASSSWGYVSSSAEDGNPSAQVLSFSDGLDKSTGRLFFYVMGGQDESWRASVTISQASVNGTMSCATLKLDPEDPRCAKLTISGMMSKAEGTAESFGKRALFARHPQMKSWPSSHHFAVYELSITHLWMIDFYGGGSFSSVTPEMYFAVSPRHNVPSFPHMHSTISEAAFPLSSEIRTAPPMWNETAKRARWLVYHSLWACIGTISVQLEGQPWGTVRSVADGVGTNSTGLPYLYLPSPDPAAVDINADARVTLSFSEAALRDRGFNCGGTDPEDPTCARLHLLGAIRPIKDNEEIARAKASLRARHPFAPWLGANGAHTGGMYYTIDTKSLTLVFLDFYGGPAKLSVKDYLSAVPN